MFLKLSIVLVAALISAGESDPLSTNTSLAGRGGPPVAATAAEVKEKAMLVAEVAAGPAVSLQKRHTYSRNGNSIDVKKNRRCFRKKRGCNSKKGKQNRYRKMCHRREKKCRSRMSDSCRRSPSCSRKSNRRCHRKYERCLLGNDRPVPTRRPKPYHPNEPYGKFIRPAEPEKIYKKEKEPCRVSSDCFDGLCCAQHGVDRRICKSYTKKDQICTRRFDRKRSTDIFERCPCEVGLKCLPDSTLQHHYSCQGT